MTTTPRLGLLELEENQALPEVVVNENARRLEQGANLYIVKDKDIDDPPGSPTDGDAYIVANVSPTGDWSGHGKDVAMYQAGEWQFVTPIEGTSAYVQDENLLYRYSGSAWAVAQGASGGVYEGGPATAPTTTDLGTWVNQGTSSVSNGTGALVLLPQADGLVHGREMTAPSAPFDLYCRFDMLAASDSTTTTQLDTVGGIMLRDDSDGELLQFGVYHSRTTGAINATAIRLQRWTNATTFSTTVSTYYLHAVPKWLRVNVTSTTVTMYVSYDGKNWISFGTETIATFIDNVTRVGVSAAVDSDIDFAALFVSYFSTTAPS